jgi:HEAT repeat protein
LPEAGYFRPDVFFFPVLIVLAIVVVGLIATTLLNRYVFDARTVRLERERLRVEGMFSRLEEIEDQGAAKRALGRIMDRAGGPNRVRLVQLINGMDEPKRSSYLDYVMHHEGRKSLIKQALRARRKWKRIEAIEILGRLEHPEVPEVLARYLEDADEDIRYVTMRTLANRSELRAAELLLNLFGTDRVNPKSLLARLEDFPTAIESLVWPRLESPDPKIRAWAATLLEVSKEKESVKFLAKAARDEDADVRSASIKSLANIGDPDAKEILPQALDDAEWFVRVAAANAAGTLGATGLSGRVIGLLSDRVWWVRQSAKTALIALCPEIEKELEERLTTDDRFVRNMVAEILGASGAVDRAATELERDPDSEEARRFFRRLAVAEGRGSIEGVAERAAPAVREALYEILDEARNIPA